jgi:carbon storage regulator
MLVLTRNVGERIRIGDDVFVTFVRLDGCRVRIGIDAPRDVEIVRCEVDERKSKQTDADVQDFGDWMKVR